jgi:hypothetical protein
VAKSTKKASGKGDEAQRGLKKIYHKGQKVHKGVNMLGSFNPTFIFSCFVFFVTFVVKLSCPLRLSAFARVNRQTFIVGNQLCL